MSAIWEAAQDVVERYRNAGLTITCAESCTGGLLAATLTNIPGSSDVFDRAFVTYSNASKREVLGVPRDLLANYGAVSPQVATAMAKGALATARTFAAVSITGIAGPSGGTSEKPVGLVYFAVETTVYSKTIEQRFGDIGRSAIRERSVLAALDLLREAAAAGR